MKISSQLNDDAVVKEIGVRISATRLGLNMTREHLASTAGVSARTIARLESGSVGTQLSVFIRVCRALGLADRLDLLLPEPSLSPMEILRLQGKRRKRASGARASRSTKKPWTWGG
jgi:transcriptional regulator with XRE-family HTH domain